MTPTASAASSPPVPPAPPSLPSSQTSRRGGGATRSDAIAVVAVTVGLLPLGVAVGAIWATLAPPIRGAVVLMSSGDRVVAYLGNEAEHFFVAPFLSTGLLGVLAALASVLAWQWQAHRGPAMAAGLCLGLLGAAALSLTAGALLVAGRYDRVDIDTAPVTPQHRVHYFVEAPPVVFGHSAMQIAAGLLLPAAVAGMIYGLCATWAARDDLNADPPSGFDPSPTELASAGGVSAISEVSEVSEVLGSDSGLTAGGGAPPGR